MITEHQQQRIKAYLEKKVMFQAACELLGDDPSKVKLAAAAQKLLSDDLSRVKLAAAMFDEALQDDPWHYDWSGHIILSAADWIARSVEDVLDICDYIENQENDNAVYHYKGMLTAELHRLYKMIVRYEKEEIARIARLVSAIEYNREQRRLGKSEFWYDLDLDEQARREEDNVISVREAGFDLNQSYVQNARRCLAYLERMEAEGDAIEANAVPCIGPGGTRSFTTLH